MEYDWSLPMRDSPCPCKQKTVGQLLSGLFKGGVGISGIIKWVRTSVSWSSSAGAREKRAFEILEAGKNVWLITPHCHGHAIKFVQF